MLLFKVLIFSPNFSCFIYFTELGFNSKYNSQHSSQREAKGSNEQLFHLHTFRPVASGVRQTLNFRKTVESCRKLYVRINNMVT